MNILDNPSAIKKLDKSGVYRSIEKLDEQCLDAWQKVQAIKIPDNYKDFSNIIVCGMGGSALGVHVIQKLYQDKLKVPLVIVRDYHLPEFASSNSLVILSSYSGNTEETVGCAQETIKKGLKSFVISSGGQLIEIAQKKQIPHYQIDPIHNPSGQPRMAIGYSIFGQLALFAKLGLVQLNEEKVKAVVQFIKLTQKQYSVELASKKNQAKELTIEIEKKIPILVAAEHLVGATHVFNNQLNENAKHFSEFRTIPELNHHLMEGLSFPQLNPKTLIFLFINSPFYTKRNQQRFKLTEDVVSKNKIQTFNYQILEAKNKLQEAFGLITFGAFVSFYTAMHHQIDPAPIPWVDYFKKSLKQLDRSK